MLHEPANNSGQIDPAAPYKSRLGLALFGLYATFYAAFVAINLVAPGLMELPYSGASILQWYTVSC